MTFAQKSKSVSAKIIPFAVTLVTVAAIVILALAIKQYRIGRSRERGYQNVKVGDSKEIVIQLMGQPDQVEPCVTVPSSQDTVADKEYQRNCFEQYWYNSFLKPYAISFDQKGRAIAKGYAVSP